MESRDELIGGEGVIGRGFVEGVHRCHDLIVGSFVNCPGMGIKGAGNFDESLVEGLGAGGVLAPEVEDSPVIGEVDAADQFTEIGVKDGIVFEKEEGRGLLLFGLADGESDGEGEGVAPLVFVSPWISTKAGIDGRETLRGHADLIEVEFQLGAAIFAASEIDVVAERESFSEVHGKLGLAFHEVEKNAVVIAEGAHHVKGEGELCFLFGRASGEADDSGLHDVADGALIGEGVDDFTALECFESEFLSIDDGLEEVGRSL